MISTGYRLHVHDACVIMYTCNTTHHNAEAYDVNPNKEA